MPRVVCGSVLTQRKRGVGYNTDYSLGIM